MKSINLISAVKKRVPIVNWLPKYSAEDTLGDLVAGLTIGLTLIPQAIAYAGLAGLGPQYGLYSAFAGSFVYIIFGTCPEVNIGPTALISLLTFTYARGTPEYAVLLCFLSGCVTIILAVLRLGFLVEFVSAPVVSGFTSAASIIIACSQLKGILGLTIHGESFLDIWRELFYKIGETKIPDLILSCCCIVILLSLKFIRGIETSNRFLSKFFWFIGTGRNALVVLLCATASYIFESQSTVPFILTGQMIAGLPKVEPPQFSLTNGNQTVGFLEICENFGSGVIVVPLISIIGNVAIAKAFSRGKALDATQEMFTLGVCNLVGSFFCSIPVAGSFSRSAVSNTSGVRTPLGGLYTGILVILALSLLTPYFYYIPRATLSSVIICAVIFMVDIELIKSVWKSSKRDLIPAIVTFLSCLFAGVELGIIVGVIIDITILIYFNARPTMYIEYRNMQSSSYVIVRPSAGLLFPAVDYLRTYLTECLNEKKRRSRKNQMNIVLDGLHIDRIDFTAIQGINSVIKDLKEVGGRLILLNLKDEILASIQSHIKENILVARTDSELTAALKKIDGSLPNVDKNKKSSEVFDGKTIIRITDTNNVSTNV